jgi:hypothetical protein
MLKFVLLIILAGCSGYRFSQQENPLAQYGIQSLSVPMFYNYSNLSEVHTDFTRETYRMLTAFPGLKLKPGYNKNTDALLIGIVKSPEKLVETVQASNLRLAQKKAQNAIGTDREKFSVPGTSYVNLYLHVILIKKPTEEEIALLKSGIGPKIKSTSKVLFNEIIPLRIQYTREIMDDEGVDIIGTQNHGVQRKIIKNLAADAAINVRDMILYAF